MAGLLIPEPGLVICYSFLWSEEAERGQIEGCKDRPCAIVLTVDSTGTGSPKQVAVIPITHLEPSDSDASIEIPPRVKAYLGLDGNRSWAILNEFNVFTWPGYDLRPISDGESRVAYGMLPPRFFEQLVQIIGKLYQEGRINQTSRNS